MLGRRRNMADITQYVFFDFEMLCSNKGMSFENMEAIRLGAVKYNIKTKEISYFDQFIQPENSQPLSSFCKKLTGIDDKDLLRANPFSAVLEEFFTWVGGIKRSKFFSWSNSDLSRLKLDAQRHEISPRTIQKFEKRYVDFQAIFTKRVANTNLSVENALALYGLPFIGTAHNPMYDSLNTFRIYQSYETNIRTSDIIMARQFILHDNELVEPSSINFKLKKYLKSDLSAYINELRDMYKLRDGKKMLKRTQRIVHKYENILINRSGLFHEDIVSIIYLLVSLYHEILATYQEHAQYQSEIMILDDYILKEMKQLSISI